MTIVDNVERNAAEPILSFIYSSRFNRNIGPQLTLSSVSRNPIGLEGEIERDNDKRSADRSSKAPNRCPPGRISRCVRSLPLGAQFAFALPFWLVAWGAILEKLRVGLIRRDLACLLGEIEIGLMQLFMGIV